MVRSAARGESIFRTAIAAKVIANAFAAVGALPAGRLDNAFSGASNDVVDSGEPDARPLVNSFTVRELEVLQQMAYGLCNERISHVLHISESTVKTHVHRVLQMLGGEDRTQAVVFAIRYRIVR